jgi:excisionase family DNA binding protein
MTEKNEKVSRNNLRLLTPSEVAEYLHVSPEQVRILIRKGQLASTNVGAGSKRPLYRVTQQALDNFLNHNRHSGPAVRKRKFKQLAPVPDFFPHLK